MRRLRRRVHAAQAIDGEVRGSYYSHGGGKVDVEKTGGVKQTVEESLIASSCRACRSRGAQEPGRV